MLYVADQARNGATNPKYIPGAVIEYCIAVTNAAGSASATSVAISDPLPTEVTYLAAFWMLFIMIQVKVAKNYDIPAKIVIAEVGPPAENQL